MNPQFLNPKAIQRKAMAGMLLSPATLIPPVLGALLLGGGLALGWPGWGASLAAAGLVLGAGSFLVKLIVGAKPYTERAVTALQEQAQRDREQALDKLDAALSETGDRSDEAALRDLRAVAQAFRELNEHRGKDFGTNLQYGIMAGVDQLFTECVESLQDTLGLWNAADEMSNRSLRQPLLRKRVLILQDVNRSIGQLGRVLVTMGNLGADAEAESALSQIRDELNRNLSVAKEVEGRMKDFERELRRSSFE